MTDTFAGIRVADVAGFLIAQAAGATLATMLLRWLVPVRPAAADRVMVARGDFRV